MLTVLVPVLTVLAGCCAAYPLLRRGGASRRCSIIGGFALGPGIAFGVSSWVFFFFVFCGSPPPTGWVLALITGAVLAVIALSCGTACDRTAGPSQLDGSFTLGRDERRRFAAAVILFGIAVGLLLWSFPRTTRIQPYGAWDATAIWNARSLFLFRSEGDLQEVYDELRHAHPDYPLLVPGTLAAQYCLLGHDDPRIPQLTGLLFSLAVVAGIVYVVASTSSTVVALAASTVFVTTPAFWRWAFQQYADIPLSYFLLITAFMLAGQHSWSRISPGLAGLFLGFLAWTKNEGLVLALLAICASSAVVLLRVWRSARLERRELLREWGGRLVRIGVGAFPSLLALGLFKGFWSPMNETARFLANATESVLDPQRWRTVLHAFYLELAPWHSIETWGLLWAFVALCIVLFWRSRQSMRYPSLVVGVLVLLAWTTYTIVYVCTPADLEWHLATSASRLVLQLTPLTLLWVTMGVGRMGAGLDREK